jgi:hypothetical protein
VPIALAALAAVAATTTAAARPGRHHDVRTRVSISSSVPAFHGRVRSPKARCRKHRRVELLRKRPGRRPKHLGSDRTRAPGRWEVAVDDLRSGVYLAKVSPKARLGCDRARSKPAIVD